MWGSDLPEDYKLWSEGDKVALGLFPWVGVAKNILQLENINYRLMSFVNITIATTAAISNELGTLRLIAMQNCMALAQSTAAQGGVCAIIETSCCTFIPVNDDDGQAIQSGVHNMTALARAMQEDKITDRQDWLTSWLTTWKFTLTRIVLIIIFVFLILCCCATCMVPIFRFMLTRIITYDAHISIKQMALHELPNYDENVMYYLFIYVI